MFSEGWGSPEGPQIGPKIVFRRSLGPFPVPPECYCLKVVLRSAFLEKGRVQAEQFLRPGAHQGDLS